MGETRARLALAIAIAFAASASPAAAEKRAAKVEDLPVVKDVPKLVVGKADKSARKQGKALNKKGLRLHRKGKYDEAEALYRKALAADAGQIFARYNLACIFNMTGRHDQGLALLAQFVGVKDCDECERRLGRATWDDEWRSEWEHPVFEKITAYQGSNGDTSDAWFRKGGSGCPKGTKRRGRIPREQDGPMGGEVFCARSDGTKHGPYTSFLEANPVSHSDMEETHKREDGQYVDGKRHGIWFFYDWGSNDGRAAYKNGKKHGVWSTSAQQGLYRSSGDTGLYIDGKAEGLHRSWFYDEQMHDAHPDGIALAETHYVAGLRHGASVSRDEESGAVTQRGNYRKDKKHGTWEIYDPQGGMEKGAFRDGLREGLWKGTYKSGAKSSEDSYRAGKLDGTSKRWSAKGKLLGSFTMKAGVGTVIEWHDNGNKALEKPLRNGNIHGVLRRWSANGNKYTEDEYVDGVQHGKTLQWHENGKQRWEGHHTRGKDSGAWTYWHENGNKYMQGSRKNFKDVGVWTEWHENGQMESKGKKVAGKRTGKWTYWHENGQKASQGKFRKDGAHGKWIAWSEDGDKQVQKWKNDSLVTLDGQSFPEYEPDMNRPMYIEEGPLYP